MIKKRPPVDEAALAAFAAGADTPIIAPAPVSAEAASVRPPAERAQGRTRKKPFTITIRFHDEDVMHDLKQLAEHLERSQNDTAVRALKRGIESMLNE